MAAPTTREFQAEKDSRIFALRRQGSPVADIAKKFAMTSSAVNLSIQRMLTKLNREALMAYPELLRIELERLDALQQSIWPLTQHRMITLPDGTQQMIEPDPKMVQMVLQIMKDRSKYLGLEQNHITLTVDEPMKASMAGVTKPLELASHTPEREAKELMAIMLKAGILPKEFLKQDEPAELEEAITDAEIIE